MPMVSSTDLESQFQGKGWRVIIKFCFVLFPSNTVYDFFNQSGGGAKNAYSGRMFLLLMETGTSTLF